MAIVIPSELKNFHSVFEKLSHLYDSADIFDCFLEYIIAGFCVDDSITWELAKRYSKNEQSLFNILFRECIKVQDVKITTDNNWYDMFGAYYESYVASKGRRSCKGQFFTPEHVCDMMVKITGETNGNFRDPCSGSGRFALAYHVHNLGSNLYVSDIDKTCCMMSVCNFLLHGCVGEVVWQDSLSTNSWFGGWMVNRNLNNPFHKYFGIPHVETLNKEYSHIWYNIEKQTEEFKNKPKQPINNAQILMEFEF